MKRSRPAFRVALDTTSWMWLDHFRSCLSRTPRCLWTVTWEMTWFPIDRRGATSQCSNRPTWRALVFSGPNFPCQDCAHRSAAVTESWNFHGMSVDGVISVVRYGALLLLYFSCLLVNESIICIQLGWKRYTGSSPPAQTIYLSAAFTSPSKKL